MTAIHPKACYHSTGSSTRYAPSSCSLRFILLLFFLFYHVLSSNVSNHQVMAQQYLFHSSQLSNNNIRIVNILDPYLFIVNKLSLLSTSNSSTATVAERLVFSATNVNNQIDMLNSKCVYSLNYSKVVPSTQELTTVLTGDFLSNNSQLVSEGGILEIVYKTAINKSSSTSWNLCSGAFIISQDTTQVEISHYGYLVSENSPLFIVSTTNMMDMWLLVMKNSIISRDLKTSMWNMTIGEAFSIIPFLNVLSEFQFVEYNSTSSTTLEEYLDDAAIDSIVSELKNALLTDIENVESTYRLAVSYGRGLAMFVIQNTHQQHVNYSICQTNFMNRNDISSYHSSLVRLERALSYFMSMRVDVLNSGLTSLNQSIFEKSNFTDFSIFNFTIKTSDRTLFADFSFYFEATRSLLSNGSFDGILQISGLPLLGLNITDLQAIKNNNVTVMNYFSSLLIHPSCFSYYFNYGEIYNFNMNTIFPIAFHDAIYFTIIFIGLFFYALNWLGYLTGFSHFLKKRLILPITGPVAVIVFCLFFTFAIRAKIGGPYYWIQMLLSIFPAPILIGTYLVSLSRFFYLKNLELMQKICCNSLRFHACVVSKPIAMIFSMLWTSVLLVLCGFPIVIAGAALIVTFLNLPNEIFIIMLAMEVVFMLVGGTLLLIGDLCISGFRKIRKKGLSYYLFFDDPFYYRIDIIAMIIMFCFTIPLIVFSTSDRLSFFVTRKVLALGFFVMFYLIIGGTLTIAYWMTKLRKCAVGGQQLEGHILQHYLEDTKFRKLFIKYCENEFSSENMLLYQDLEIILKKDKIYMEDILEIDQKYMANMAPNEVNFPHDVKKAWKALLEKFKEHASETEQEQHQSQDLVVATLPVSNSATGVDESAMSTIEASREQLIVPMNPNESPRSTDLTGVNKFCITPDELKQLLMHELVKNMVDTFSRMELTNEFKHWKGTKDLQAREMGVVNKV